MKLSNKLHLRSQISSYQLFFFEMDVKIHDAALPEYTKIAVAEEEIEEEYLEEEEEDNDV